MDKTWLSWLALGLGGLILLRILAEPARYLALLLMRTALGYLVLWALNWIGLLAGFHLPLNPVTGMVVGVLGLPGLGAIIVLQRFYS